ncbi:MAG: tetratricopeptide repeat protein [Flammeovirgaceae bacterium]|nr:tetratricopeptide repeat protein [Flammeovirgaceae bacterium]
MTSAQGERKYIREGNEYYAQENFEKAQEAYLKGIEENQDSYEAAFNLGDALYKKEKYEEAAEQFEMLANTSSDKNQLANAYHNLGNSLLKTQKYKESVEAYKNALRNNPSDEETRYNLAYAMEKLKEEQQQQQNQQDQNNQDNQNKDQKDQENKENQENKDQENKGQENQDQQNQEQQDQEQKDQQNQQQQQQGDEQPPQQGQAPQKQGISKEDAQRLLEALQNQEQQLQNDMKKKKMKGNPVKIKKDW